MTATTIEDRAQELVADQPSVGPAVTSKPSYHNRKIQCAIADEIAAGGSMETLNLLTPAERRRRLNEHLTKRGVREKELPTQRTYQRYFNGR